MRVLYISNDSGISGSTIALQNIILCLRSKGVEPFVVCRDDGELTQWLQTEQIPYCVFSYNWNYQPSKKTIRDKIAFAWRIYKYYREEKNAINQLIKYCKVFTPDIIHTNNGIIHFGFKTAKRLGIKHVWHLREYQNLDFGMTPIPSMNSYKKMLQSSFCISITEGVRNHFNLSKERCRVIYDAVLPMNSQRYSSKKEDYYLFVGRIEPSKGIEELIRAYHLYVRNGGRTQLLLAGVGKDEYVVSINHMIDCFKLTSFVRFLGFRKDCYDLMYKAKALVVPSRFEGFGFITVEAIMNGCIVFGHNTAGTAEIASVCRNMVVLFDNIEQLASLLMSDILIEDSVVEADQRISNQMFTNEISAQAVYDYYLTISNVKP